MSPQFNSFYSSGEDYGSTLRNHEVATVFRLQEDSKGTCSSTFVSHYLIHSIVTPLHNPSNELYWYVWWRYRRNNVVDMDQL